jgi:hypothetical protein
MKRLLVCATAVAAIAMGGVRADAATLTIVDSYNGGTATWSLTTETGCTSCATTLSVTFSATGGYDQKYLDSVQYKIDGSDPTGVTLLTTTAGTTSQWSFTTTGVVAADQCTGGNQTAVCGEWTAGSVGGGGFGPIAGGSTLTWTFTTTYASALPTSGLTGNIRGAFNNADGSNFNIFSPGGGSFDGDGGGSNDGDGGNSPEPATLMLFGLALSGAGFRMRRARA